jgi:4-amino-4-deoxy-L-arabinose transferase-like glycosyltransferase
MFTVPPLRLVGIALFLAVVAAAAGARAWYLTSVTKEAAEQAPLHAQDPPPPARLAGGAEALEKKDPTELDNLVYNLRKDRWFGGLAPLAEKEERTAHVAPGYPWLLSLADTWLHDPRTIIRWVQCALGALTAGLYFLFARRAFYSLAVALLAGLFCALNPFWIVNTAEINDGVLATFLLAACLFLGTRASQQGAVFTAFVFGAALAGLALVRAALLPFTVVALLWFLWRCRLLRSGWLCALVALLGFGNGVAFWTVRNFRAFDEVVPVADSMFLHLWEGNNVLATGGPQDEETLRRALPPEWGKKVLDESSQPRRYNLLARPLLEEVQADPAGTLRRRVWAAEYFVFGQAWFSERLGGPAPGQTSASSEALPDWVQDHYALLVLGPLVVMLVLGFLGWRWTYPWRQHARLATLAVLWVPLPYVLGHAERLWGPRLPLDGVLWCLAAFALLRLMPGVGRRLTAGPVVAAPAPARMPVRR